MDMNKPVAWIGITANGFQRLSIEKLDEKDIPLYTHPHSEESVKVKELKNIVVASATCSCGKVMEITNLQPVKELTDEEIMELQAEYGIDSDLTCHSVKDFVLAILRKANEK